MSEQDKEPLRDSTPPAQPQDAAADFQWESTDADGRRGRISGRRQRLEARRQRRGGRPSAWIGGAILIGLGIIFLLQNLGMPVLMNWWALFILIPAFGAFAAAWQAYRHDGRLTRRSGGSVVAGLFLTALALIFLVNLDLGQFWPFLLIAGGIILLLAALLPD